MSNVSRLAVAACCAAALVSGCKRKSADPPASPGSRSGVADASALLAELLEGHAEVETFVFAERGGGVAWVRPVAGKARVVHNGREGPPFESVGTVVLSADGRRCAYGAVAGGKWRMVVDGEEGETFDELGVPVFSADGTHVAYDARVGASWRLVVDGQRSAAAPTRYAWYAFGTGASRIAFVEHVDEQGRGRLVVSDLRLERSVVVDERVSNVVVSADGAVLAAVSVRDQGQQLLTFRIEAPERVTRGRIHDGVYSVVLSADGAAVAYLAERAGEYFVVLDGREEQIPAGESAVELPAVSADKGRVAIAVITAGGVRAREFFGGTTRSGALHGGIEGLAYASGSGALAYVANVKGKYFVVVNGKEGPQFERVVSPMFSSDGKILVYRARMDGKRFVVVADAEGKTVRQHPAYEQVFPVQFTADGKSVAYGVKDGRQLAWKVEPL